MRHFVISALAGFSLLSPALAEEKREADAHEHGHGTFNMAIEGNTVVIELETPAFDILGFEYAAKSDAEKEAVETARKTLAAPVALFGLSEAAECKVTEAEIEIGAEETGHDDHDDDHDDEHAEGDDHDDKHAEDDEHHDDHDEKHAEGEEHHDDHDDEHAEGEEHHDDHDDEHAEGDDHHDEDEAEHSEVHAHLTLTCGAPKKIGAVNMSGYFEAFPNAKELDAAILSDAGQASGELEPDRPELSL